MIDDALSQELVATLVDELRDQISAMRTELAALASGPGAEAPLRVLHRIAHTLKGASRAAGVPDLEGFCGELEARILRIQDRGLPPGPEDVGGIATAISALSEAAERLGSGRDAALPFAREGAGAEPGLAPAMAPRAQSLRVLAVEDSPTQAAKLRAALELGGYGIVEARTADDALRAFADESVDLVVSDVMMPGEVDGYGLCRLLKRRRPDCPVVLLTSLADPLDVIRGLEVGADSFLTKPYEPEHLLARLDLLLSNRKARGARSEDDGLSVRFLGRTFLVQAGRDQILDLLVTTFEDAVRKNRDLLRREQELSTRTEELERALRALEQAQEQLAQKERLAVLGRLSGSVGHELRNPLGVMTNAVYFLKMLLRDAPEKVGEYLGILRHQITLAEKIVGDLLDFARIKPPQRAPTELKRLVDDQTARVTLPPNVRVQTDLGTAAATVLIDPMQIGQVVLNLITNAVQAMETPGGVLSITARSEGAGVTLSFQDEGPGIAEENRQRIFEPLFTTKARGIGLGLSVSRSLAEANGLKLLLAPPTGKGARFDLVFPAEEG